MTITPFDQSSMARARRKLAQDAEVARQMREANEALACELQHSKVRRIALAVVAVVVAGVAAFWGLR